MFLPSETIKNIVSEICKAFTTKELEKNAQQLSRQYRSGSKITLSEGQKYAYLLTRFPATYAAISEVLDKIKGKAVVETFLDIGSGPGTGLWAVQEFFPSLKAATLVEKEEKFIQISRALIQRGGFPNSIQVKWEREDATKKCEFSPHDLVLLSYVLNELPEKTWHPVLENVWRATKKLLVLIEPGTPQGFKRILWARDTLIKLGAHLVAPCPHEASCPLANTSDWCHFSVRLARSQEHRRLKGATLSFEDEKFCYLVVSKSYLPLCSNRILRPPQKHSGHVVFDLCTPQGTKKSTISRKEGEKYQSAKKLLWGDEL